MDTLFQGWDAVQRGRMVEDRDGAAVLAATVAAPMHRIEIIGERRLAHAAEVRAEMVAQSLVPGIRIQDVARRNGICASLIYRWRRWRPGSAAQAQLVPVRIASESPPGIAPTRSLRTVPQVSRRAASIEIELAGDVRVRVDEDVSLPALRRVIAALRG
jgi:transposase